MVRHVVLWRLKPLGVDDRLATLARISQALQAQVGRIPGLLRLEVGSNFAASRRAADFALLCDFENRSALENYHRHPAHLETRAIVDPLIAEHWIVDYET